MPAPDLNLLLTLEVLLAEGSVAAAARRLQLSPSAMSRTLARLRAATGDPLLVRAGRSLVPTPRALELASEVGTLVEGAKAMLRPATGLDPSRLIRTFVLRTSEGFVETFGPKLIARLAAEAPGVTLQFLTKTDKDSAALRNGTVDLETGVVDETTAPELRTMALFHDRRVGVVRAGHKLSRSPMTPARYASGDHILVSRQGLNSGQIDEGLNALGLKRNIVTIVSGFATALALARVSDLIASVPDRHTEGLREGMHSFALPFPVLELTVSMLWHPRMEADPGHRWLRRHVHEVCIEPKPDRVRKRASA